MLWCRVLHRGGESCRVAREDGGLRVGLEIRCELERFQSMRKRVKLVHQLDDDGQGKEDQHKYVKIWIL